MADLPGAIAARGVARAGHDPVAYARADNLFHETFIRNCRNRYLQEGYAHVSGPIATLSTQLSVSLAGAQERSYLHHKEITEAFAAGAILSIEQVLTEHILSTRKSCVTALQDGLIGAAKPGADL